MPGWYAWQGNDLLVWVTVQPRARADELVGIHGDTLRIRITAPPVDGKANAHLCAYVAGLCGLNKSAVTLVSGETSRRKRLRIPLQTPTLPAVFAGFC